MAAWPLAFAFTPRHVGVRAVVVDEVAAGIGDVGEHAGHEVQGIDGLYGLLVVAGGLIDATVGRFIVHRHQRAESGAASPKAELSLFPIHNGLGIAARF